MSAVESLFSMAWGRGPQKANYKLLRQFNITSRPKVQKNGQPEEQGPPATLIVHELLHCVKEQQQLQYRQKHPEEDKNLQAALQKCDMCANLQGKAADAARQQLARFVALLLKRVCVRGNALGLGSSTESFNSLNNFIDRRLEVLVRILFPWAADPVVASALNALATGATDFTCKTYVRAGIAAPLIGRFALAVLRCALEQGDQQGGTCRQVPGGHMESVCACLRMAFKSLDDALRIVASAPNGPADLARMDLKKTFQDISALFKQLYRQALMSQVGELHVSAVLLAAIQLECSPIIFNASDKWVSPTLINLLKERRWVGGLCNRLHSFRAGTGHDLEEKPADITGKSSSELTSLLQLLKAVLQATELFSHRHKDLQRVVHDLVVMEPDVETGIPVSLLESLIKTLCGGAPMSTAHAHKIAFILRICVARHSDWHLSEQLLERHRLVNAVFIMLDSSLGRKKQQKQAAGKATSLLVRPQGSSTLQKDPQEDSWSLWEYITGAPPKKGTVPSLGGQLTDQPKGKLSADEEARRSEEAYMEGVRVGMAADKAPAAAAVASAIVEHEETLLKWRKDAPPLVLQAEFNRLQQLLKSYMPEATGFGIPIDHNRRDNICKGIVTDDVLPQDLMEDSILEEKGTLPNSGSAAPHVPPRIRVVHPGGSASKDCPQEMPDGAAPMQSTAGSQDGGESVEEKLAQNAQLQEKVAELRRLKALKAAAEQQQSQSAKGQKTQQKGSPGSKGQRPSSADIPDSQASKSGNSSARDALPPNQAARPSADPGNMGFSSTWQNVLSLGRRRFGNTS